MEKNESKKYIDEQVSKNKNVVSDLKKLDKINEEKKRQKQVMSEALKKTLLYVGFIGAIISAMAYLIITIVMIKGVSTDISLENQILFSVLGAVVGLLISFLLRNQGIIYAKQNEEAQEVMQEYRKQINETKTYKELHTISWYIFWATIRDIFLKGLTVALSTWFVLYIFIEGSGEWGLLGLAISNILMFSGFGLVGLATVYDKYLEEHIPVIKQRIKRLKKINEEKETKEKEELKQKQIDELKKDNNPTAIES